MNSHRMTPSPWPAGHRLEHHLLGEVGDALRRPLWTIMASAQVLLKSRDLTPRDARLADRIDANAHALARMVRDLLDHALAEVGLDMPLALHATDMRRIAQEALVGARIDHPDRWITHASGGDGAAEWDHDRVLQLLSNLLAYAVEHASDGDPVTFSWWGEEDEIVAEVEFVPEDEAAPGEPRLGLAIARQIAHAHGGELELAEAAAGAVLTVTLPRHVPARGAGERARPPVDRERSELGHMSRIRDPEAEEVGAPRDGG